MAAKLTAEEQQFLEEAVQRLEYPSFLLRATHAIGVPIEKGISALPQVAQKAVTTASRKAIDAAFSAALQSLPAAPPASSFAEALRSSGVSGRSHAASGAVVGAVGGFFGLPALALELPITTTILFRSMAAIAARFGESLDDPRTRLDCLCLFSLGSRSSADDAVESAYYGARLGFATLLEQSLAFVAGKTAKEILRAVEGKSAPAIVSLLVRVAGQFEIVVSEKAIAQLIPGIGAAAGATLNLAFAEHYAGLARAHFGLRHLERKHGESYVKRQYDDTRRRIAAEKKK